MLVTHSPSTATIPFDYALDRSCVHDNIGQPPLLVLLHGSGDDENGLLDIGRALAPSCGGALILSLRGPRPRGPFGYCWFEGSSASPAPDAEASIASAADGVLHLLQNAPAVLNSDPERVYLFGHSQGASVSWAVSSFEWPRPNLLRGIACNSGRLFPGLTQPSTDLGQRVAPTAALAERHVLSAHGVEDMITPVQIGRQNGAFCQTLGLPNTYHEHDEGHNDLQQPLAHVLKHFEASSSSVRVVPSACNEGDLRPDA